MGNPRIDCCRFPFDSPERSDDPRICFYDPEGILIESKQLQVNRLSRLYLEIDLFGRCVVKSNNEELLEIPNPMQHPRQIELWKEMLADQARKKADEQRRLVRSISRSPFLDNQ